jgi:hypothetical protein
LSVFDLIFLLAVLCTFITLVTAGTLAIRGRRSQALRLLGIWTSSAAIYVVVGLAVSFLRPQSVRSVGEPWCFDDWCVTVQSVQLDTTSANNTYRVDLLLESRAKRISQRAKGAWIYLIDHDGRRFAPGPSQSVPLDVLLSPGASIATTRTFQLPAGIRAIGLVTGHGGPPCGVMNFLIIGNSGCVFQKPAMVRIN